ncbi:hypothetical protein [Bdellovibrio sp. HCB-162]|uniref:hypothetical protein n=1 Tax=Bdellovibrio sp. HCB-162 TaxID=3394234 RepID=UPI0039BD77E6
MKTKILSALLIVSIAWGSVVSYLYWKLKSNPRVVAISMEAGKESLQNIQLGEMEKMTFLRQYLDRFYNYDSNNFWQSQTSLAFLMAPKLSEERVREVSRLREKIQQKNLSQLGQLKSLKKFDDGSYEAETYLQIHQETQQKGELQKNELYVTSKLKLQNAERTLENPWGLLVQEMTFSSSPQVFSFSPQIHVEAQTPTLVTFPCAIENIENPAEKDLKIKITTLNVSELQITPSKELKLPVSLTAICKDTEYKFDLLAKTNERDLYVSFPKESGTIRKKEIAPTKTRKKDVYEKTIENVLGIKLDQ